MHKCARTLFMFVVAFAAVPPAHGQSMEQAMKVDVRISSDQTVETTYHYETTPRVEAAVRGVAQSRWQLSGNQKFEVLEAFTRKADGHIVPADPREFSVQEGVVGEAMSFVDLKIEQIPFRDLSVGDTTVLTVRIIEKDHYIPGQYSQQWFLPPGPAKMTLDLTLRAPAALEIRHDEVQFAYQETREDGDVMRHWAGDSTQARAEETNVVNFTSLIPSLRFSTIPNFQAIAKGYFDGANGKSAVTPEIQHLADDITKDKFDFNSQAEALFDWVSRNIRYVAVYFGNGRYVPNDAHTILSRRFGDCKDHATLLVALLAAKGIEAEHTLINVTPTYQLAKTPTLTFNHVIVYIPVLDRYVDPTVPFGSFGHLPTSDLDKPVLRASRNGGVLARTPNLSIDDNVLELNTRIVLTEDGRQQGQTSIETRGEFADLLRAAVAQWEAKGTELGLQALARLRGYVGEFALDASPWTVTSEPYRIATKWNSNQPLDLFQTGWRAPAAFSPLTAFPDLFFGPLDRAKRVYPAGCRAGRAVHTLDVTLPAGIVPDHPPAAVETSARDFLYRQEWFGAGNHLRVRTEVTSTCQSRVSTPEQIDAVRAAFHRIEERINPLLHFTRADAQREQTNAGRQSQNLVVAPSLQ